jgi:hypothetical protein
VLGLALLAALGLAAAGCENKNAPPTAAAKGGGPPPGANPGGRPQPGDIYSDKLDHEHIDRITLGMSPQDVEKLIGPTHLSNESGGVKHMRWPNQERTFEAKFKDDKLVSKAADGLEQETAKITKENAEKVQNGMTLKEVVALLGPSKRDEENESKRVLSWEKEGLAVHVTFTDGKVSGKEVGGS